VTKRILSNADITYVSFVDKGANKRPFYLVKSDTELAINKQIVMLTKADEAQQLAYGVVYEPDVDDAHGDRMTAAEIEKAAHRFMTHQNIDRQHNFQAGAGQVVESYIAPADLQVGGQLITKGSWVMAVKASDEVWADIQKGAVTAFSMAGIAEVTPIQKDEGGAAGTAGGSEGAGSESDAGEQSATGTDLAGLLQSALDTLKNGGELTNADRLTAVLQGKTTSEDAASETHDGQEEPSGDNSESDNSDPDDDKKTAITADMVASVMQSIISNHNQNS
jgi:hypothetical protein